MSLIPMIQLGLVGISMGAVYALIAIGFMIIFWASNIVYLAAAHRPSSRGGAMNGSRPLEEGN
jgi:hypothetical protein